MTRLGTAIVAGCLVAMWVVAAYVIGQDTPVKVPADIRPVPSYTPFTQTPRSGGAMVGQLSDPTLSGLAP